MAFFREQDAISGKMAQAFATVNGQVYELFYATTGEVNIEKNKVDLPILGRTNTAQRSSGWSGSGTLTVYYVSSVFRELMINYIKTGQDFYFDLMIVNEQPGSNTGRQSVTVKNCNLDSMVLAKFDATTDDALDEELPFTFSDADLGESFTSIN